MKSYSRVEEFSTVLRGAIIETYLLFFLNTKPALVIYQGCYRLAVLGMILTTDVCASAGLLILLQNALGMAVLGMILTTDVCASEGY